MVFYGADIAFMDSNRNGYTCEKVMRDRDNNPVIISQRRDGPFPVWKVQHGFSCLVFLSREEAMDYSSRLCRKGGRKR